MARIQARIQKSRPRKAAFSSAPASRASVRGWRRCCAVWRGCSRRAGFALHRRWSLRSCP